MTIRRNLFKVSTVTQLLLDLAILGWLDKTLPNTKSCCTAAFGYISIDGITPSNQDIFL
jgi:hypothetical protein